MNSSSISALENVKAHDSSITQVLVHEKHLNAAFGATKGPKMSDGDASRGPN